MEPESCELTVIIPTWNRQELLVRCLQALRRQTAPLLVLVVDDGSSDGTAARVRNDFPYVRLFKLPENVGFAAAVNRGLELVRTPYVALLNNDTEPEPGWAEAGLRALRNSPPEYAFFACRMLQYFQRDLLDGAGDIYTRTGLPLKRGFGLPATHHTRSDEVLGASAGAAFYRMDMLRQIGFLDEDYYMYLEDVEISLRARMFGYRCRYLADAVVYHQEAASDPERRREVGPDGLRAFYSDRRVYWITRNRWLLMVTYQPWRHVPWLGWGWAKSLLFHIFRAGHTGAFLRGLAAGLAATRRAAAKRRRLARSRPDAMQDLCRLMTLYWPSV